MVENVIILCAEMILMKMLILLNVDLFFAVHRRVDKNCILSAFRVSVKFVYRRISQDSNPRRPAY